MTYEAYKEELQNALDHVDWRNPRDKEGPAYRVLARAAVDKAVTLDEWQELNSLYYRRTER